MGMVNGKICLVTGGASNPGLGHAIAHKLARVEAGAQGEHKLARGYVPVTTYSAHWIRDPALRRAVARYLEDERRAVAETTQVLAEFAPYRKDAPE